jgi:2'-5' RNA ligase
MTVAMRDPADSDVRMFFAAIPAAETRELLLAAAQSVRLEPESRLVPAMNYHLTLAFVGAIPAPRVVELQAIGRAQRAQRFSVRFDAYEYWPKPEVIVAAARTIPAALEQLWQQLHRDLAHHQWALDPKRLRPHVTLARKVSQAPVLQAMSSFDWFVHDLSLVRSDTSGNQSAYTVVDTWPLLDDADKQ